MGEGRVGWELMVRRWGWCVCMIALLLIYCLELWLWFGMCWLNVRCSILPSRQNSTEYWFFNVADEGLWAMVCERHVQCGS